VSTPAHGPSGPASGSPPAARSASPPGAGDAFASLGGWPGVLARLMTGDGLSSDEAELSMGEVLSGAATPAQLAAFVTALRMKGETVEEMSGFVRAMLSQAEPLEVAGDLVDTCGTGGDRSRSINVSTIAAFVAAGAGARVCKHGGRAASSAAGSADVLEALGVSIDLGPEGVARCIEEVGMGFCFAPRFHPAMRHAAPVRGQLGVPTVFNFLGPLANPARARFQVVGVSDLSMAEKMLGVLRANGTRRAMVVHGADGLDELSTTGASTVLSWSSGDGDGEAAAVERTVVEPAALGLAPASLEDLRGGDAATNAAAARRVLEGERGAHRDIVVLNAGAALAVCGRARSLEDGLSLAQASVDSGRARAVLEGLVRVSGEAART
jgi:anthranilate phosphoribosyltransferase